MNKSNICYLRESEVINNRPGYTYNLVTGCKHGCPWCWARRMVETRLKDHPAYPYGFEPTFHPERVKAFGGVPKLIALNFMGDVGGDWPWLHSNALTVDGPWSNPQHIASFMREFAELNPQHIILLLTKNPAWYQHGPFPDNVWCGFSASNNREFEARWGVIDHLSTVRADRRWVSLEPWLDEDAPFDPSDMIWLVIGGLTGKGSRGVSPETVRWIQKASEFQSPLLPREFPIIFVKDNSKLVNAPRQYPDEWTVT